MFFLARTAWFSMATREEREVKSEGPAHFLLITLSTLLFFSLASCRLSAKHFVLNQIKELAFQFKEEFSIF